MRSITSGATEAPKKTGTLKGSFGNHDDERRSRVPPGFRGPLPDGPVPLSACNGSLFDAELVPLAHSHLRLTVLPVLADE